MEITRRSDYACRILRAAYRANGEYLSISAISEEEGIPYAFARNIQHALLRAGYVKTRRGAHGGLALNIDPETITLYQLMQALEVTVSLAPCAEDPECCENSPKCGFNKVWRSATDLLVRYFDSLTLKDVLDGKVGVQGIALPGESAPADSASAFQAQPGDEGEPVSCGGACAHSSCRGCGSASADPASGC